uniref:Uncharacterized protein n=1 Tax=mine drainage metagenome TaxID=410659 RepID=E6QJ81_9ZZZZ
MQFSGPSYLFHYAIRQPNVRNQSLTVILVRKNFCGTPFRLCRANTFVWSVVQRHKAIFRHCQGDIVVAHQELNFHVTRVQRFHDGSDLATQKVLLWYGFQKRYNVE